MSTCRAQPRQRRPMSAPRRSTSHVSPPHGCGRLRRTTSPRSRGRTLEGGIRRVRVSEPWLAMARDEGPLGRRQLEPVDRRDRDLDARERGLEPGDDAPGPGQRARQRRGVADRVDLERVAERRVLDRDARRAGRPRPSRTRCARRRSRYDSAPALRSSLSRSWTAVPGTWPRDRHLDPGPADRQETGPRADAGEVRLELAERRVAPGPGGREGVELVAGRARSPSAAGRCGC